MFRLVLLGAIGLGAMYMLHLLAQDYDKIRQPVAMAARAFASASNVLARGKRSTSTAESSWYYVREQAINDPQPQRISRNTQNIQTSSSSSTTTTTTTFNIDWKRILSRDPFECLQSLICQLAAGAEQHSHEAKLLIEFVEATVAAAPVPIQRAFSKGLVLRGGVSFFSSSSSASSYDLCYDEYPFCIYSARTMLRVLRWFAETTSDDEDN